MELDVFNFAYYFVAYIHIPADEVIASKYVVCMTSYHILKLYDEIFTTIISNWVIWSWSSVARYNRLNDEDKQKGKTSILKTSWKFTTENIKRFSSFLQDETWSKVLFFLYWKQIWCYVNTFFNILSWCILIYLNWVTSILLEKDLDNSLIKRGKNLY